MNTGKIRLIASRYFNKRNVLLAVSVLILLALAFFIRGLCVRISVLDFLASHSTGYYQGFAAPTDAEWYTIDTERFGIDSTGGNARATTDGINAALRWAREQGFRYVRFPEGTYTIQCLWRNRFAAPTDGILVPSGLTLDLGDAVFAIEPNSFPEYCIFGVVNASDVTILGGTLVGDRDTHEYAASESSPTHEFGFGICVSASSNVLIQGVTIRGMTGDGIILEGSYTPLSEGGAISTGIRILGCDISDCRRQGISVVGASHSEIAHNRIWDIGGTSPQFGIDVEAEMDYIVSGLTIHHNVIAGCRGGTISCHSGSDYEVFANACRGSIIAVRSSGVKILDNIIEHGRLQVYTGATGIELNGNFLGPGAKLVNGDK